METSRLGDLHLHGLMVNSVLLGTCLQERQEHVGLGHVGTDVTGIVGGVGWKQVLSYRAGRVSKRGLRGEGAWGGMKAEDSFTGLTRSLAA